MDPVVFEQFSMPKNILGSQSAFLKEGEIYDLASIDDQVISAAIPNLVVLKVAETNPGVKGNSVSNVFKDAILENGLKVKVPLFINQGDKIKVDTRSFEYVERIR